MNSFLHWWEILVGTAGIVAAIIAVLAYFRNMKPQAVTIVHPGVTSPEPAKGLEPAGADSLYDPDRTPAMEEQTNLFEVWTIDAQTPGYHREQPATLSLIADLGHTAPVFDSAEKDLLCSVVRSYLSVGSGLAKEPVRMSDYLEFEFQETRSGRAVFVRATQQGIVEIDVHQPFHIGVPWDWILMEGYVSLLCLRDRQLRAVFAGGERTVVVVTLCNILDIDVQASAGLSAYLICGPETRGRRRRISSIQSPAMEIGSDDEAWQVMKQFTKRALADTGAANFEKALQEIRVGQMRSVYFSPKVQWQRAWESL